MGLVTGALPLIFWALVLYGALASLGLPSVMAGDVALRVAVIAYGAALLAAIVLLTNPRTVYAGSGLLTAVVATPIIVAIRFIIYWRFAPSPVHLR